MTGKKLRHCLFMLGQNLCATIIGVQAFFIFFMFFVIFMSSTSMSMYVLRSSFYVPFFVSGSVFWDSDV